MKLYRRIIICEINVFFNLDCLYIRGNKFGTMLFAYEVQSAVDFRMEIGDCVTSAFNLKVKRPRFSPELFILSFVNILQ